MEIPISFLIMASKSIFQYFLGNILDVDLLTTDDQSIAEELISRGVAISEERRRAVSLSMVQKLGEPEQNTEAEEEEQAEAEEILG